MASPEVFPVSLAVSRPMELQWMGVLYTGTVQLQKLPC